MPGQAATEKWLTGGGDKDTKDSDEVNSEVGGGLMFKVSPDGQVRLKIT